eukprot:SRR837773.12165.p1 GENE.SRR837773.12165~~SRR837773.12165.p1  ORF type:complete len:258 (+),score=119.58 SRR837773.12165:58-774(+)
MAEKMRLTYWPIVAKNIAPAIALEVGGFDWEMGPGPGSKGTGNLWGEWLEMKPNTVWAFLPNLEVPGARPLGSELAILQYLARKNAALAGATDEEFQVSQELLHQAEELYQKITEKVPTSMDKTKSPENFKAFMEGADKTTHSNAQGLQVYLDQFEEFYGKVGGKDGKFTSAGTTIGEIKLFSVLALLPPIQADVFARHPNLQAFMAQFGAREPAKAVMECRARNMTPLVQYFIAPPQ